MKQKKARSMSDIMDDVFSPDVRVYHNELQELTGIVGLTERGKKYLAGELWLYGMDIDSLQFPELVVEYIERS